MLDQNKINAFSVKAKAAGYTDAQIAAEIARKKQELQTPIQPATPTNFGGGNMDLSNPGFAGDQPAPAEKGGLVSNLKNAGSWIANTFFPATKNFVQDVASGLTVKIKDYQNMVTANQTAQAGVTALVKRAQTETDPAKKKKLLDLAREQSDKLGVILNEGTPKFSKDVNKSAVERGLAVGTEVGTAIMTPEAKGATAATRVISAAKQGAMLAGARGATTLEDLTPEERLKKTLVDAGLGALTVGGLQAGGEAVGALARGSKATKVVGENISQKGADIKQGVRKIQEPAGVWGSQKEDAINETLTKLNINGTASQQYKQLAPRYDELTKQIQTYLKDTNKVVDPKKIEKLVTADLTDIPGDVLAESQGKAEYDKILKEVAKVKDSNSLFELKKWLNGRLGRVYTKMEKGNPLSPAEEVILNSRDTIDQAFTKLHPEIKDLTMTQSHLRDAAPSLAKARLVTPTLRVAGTTVPVSVSQKAQDMAGSAVQKTGQVVAGAGELGSKAFTFAQPGVNAAVKAGQKVAPILVSPSTPFENVQNVTQNTQGNEGQVTQNEQGKTANSKTDHTSNIPQTVTGRTVEQHMAALSKAKAAGDTAAATAIKAQLDIETAYQKTLPSAKPLTAQQKIAKLNADSGLRALDKMDAELSKNPSAVWQAWIPGSPGARVYATARKEASDVLTRLRTGAALNADEQKFYISQLPQPLDSAETITYKMKLFRDLFDALSNPDSVAATDMSNTLGGFSNGQ